ncbi:MAG TPA: NAD(P)/FAD-dependent oxidoreductase [Deltaproteobacteria bacterium]|nr:NAD(P)/FAD-dependent oxidoreductase [Deltaproteobacteria bacterium]
MRGEMAKDFDCIVIGAGIGGLTAAGRLAARGVKVLVVEKNPVAGGYLQSFRRRGFTFDAAVDCFSGLDRDGPLSVVLRELGVESMVTPVRVDPIRRSLFPGLTVDVHASMERYAEDLKALFPAESKGIDGLFRAMDAIYSDIMGWCDYCLGRAASPPLSPEIVRLSGVTFDRFLDEHVSDPKLRGVLADRCPFYGLSPSRVSAFSMIALVMSYFRSGAYRVAGGSQRLAEAVVEGIRRKGGEVRTGVEARRLVTEGGRVKALCTSEGEELTARHFISNIDYRRTMALAGREPPDGLPDVSSSFFILYVGARMDLARLGRASSIGSFSDFDMEPDFAPAAPFRPETTFGVTIPTILDPSMAPPGCHSVVAHEMTSSRWTDSWQRDKAALARRLLAKVETIVEGLGAGTVCMDAATPATLERYTANTAGAAYGWSQGPGVRPPEFGLANLRAAGHWASLGGGVVAAAYAGVNAAREVALALGADD